ncbi:hypothetical protein ACB098_01G225300 [Castanea mollissima]
MPFCPSFTPSFLSENSKIFFQRENYEIKGNKITQSNPSYTVHKKNLKLNSSAREAPKNQHIKSVATKLKHSVKPKTARERGLGKKWKKNVHNSETIGKTENARQVTNSGE